MFAVENLIISKNYIKCFHDVPVFIKSVIKKSHCGIDTLAINYCEIPENNWANTAEET